MSNYKDDIRKRRKVFDDAKRDQDFNSFPEPTHPKAVAMKQRIDEINSIGSVRTLTRVEEREIDDLTKIYNRVKVYGEMFLPK